MLRQELGRNRCVRIRPHAKSGAAERVNRSAPFPPHFLRVAASSNTALEATRNGSNVRRHNHQPSHAWGADMILFLLPILTVFEER